MQNTCSATGYTAIRASRSTSMLALLMRRRACRRILLLLPLAAAAGCTQSRSIEIGDAPAPKALYEVTLQIHQPPGPFEDTARGWVYYRAENNRCLPLTPISGATIYPDKTIEFTVTRVSATEYRGTFFADRLQDQDYYGLGVCHWTVNTLGIALSGNGVRFDPALGGTDLRSGKPVTTYYTTADYLRRFDRTEADGSTSREFLSTQAPGSVFDMTLTTRPVR
jgi:hypothetical protein